MRGRLQRRIACYHARGAPSIEHRVRRGVFPRARLTRGSALRSGAWSRRVPARSEHPLTKLTRLAPGSHGCNICFMATLGAKEDRFMTPRVRGLVRARAVLWAGWLAVPACAGAGPSPHALEDCDERTVRAFRESLEGDTILVRHWHGFNPPIPCHDGEAAASCEARARASLLHKASPERAVYSCTSEPGASCWGVRHEGEVSTLHYKNGWDGVAEALWARWGRDEIDVVASSFGDVRAASATSPIEDDDPRFSILVRRNERAQAEIKAAARGWPALRVGLPGGSESTHWLRVPVSCRPRNEPHPSAHKGSWYCASGPPGPTELVPNECFTSETSCAITREHLMQEVRMRGGRYGEIGQCSAAPRVYCYEMEKEYTNQGSWQSHRLFYCYPSRERCEQLRPEHLLHASVTSACFEAGSGISGD
jgi:hypothetical protein